jgi:3'-phosphoadenosine 5'-phosphosulfate (PAPS) 3'-phosphatase
MLQIDTTQSFSHSSFSPTLAQLGGVLREAASVAKMARQSSDYRVEVKPDGSYVTTVDMRVNAFLNQRLPEIFQGAVISEEGYPSFSARKDAACYWIIDPIDNTKGLVETGIEESCINVALFKSGAPLAAAIHYFSDDSTYFGTLETGVLVQRGSEVTALNVRRASTPARFVAYKPTLAEMSQNMQEALGPHLATGGEIVHKDKLPLRLRALLDGEADIYIDPREINEWDVAAGLVLSQFLGARLSALDSGDSIKFNTEKLKCSPFNLHFDPS